MPYAPTVTVDDDLPKVRDHLRGAGEYIRELRSRAADKRGDTFADDMRSAVDFVHEYDALLTAMERSAAPAAPTPAGPAAGFTGLEARRSAGHEFTSADGYEQFAQGGGRGSFQTEIRALLTSGDLDDVGSGAEVWRPVGTPFMRPGTERRQRLFVRDLISVQGTGLSSVPYIREVTPATFETGATTVAEGSAKPEVTMQFVQVDAPIRKIAAWIPATEEILADAPTLRGYIDTRLAYMIQLREEQQVLKGLGTGTELRGIYETTGTQSQTAIAGDVPATTALSIGKVENVDGDADGVVYNPLDYWGFVSTRHSSQFDNQGHPLVGPPASAPPNASWGLREVRSRALAATECLVGSFFLGATLFQRAGITVRVGDQHSDYFVTNKVAILAEERVGLAVHRPDWFVETVLDLSA